MAKSLERVAAELVAAALEAFDVLGGRFVVADRNGSVIMSSDDWGEAKFACKYWRNPAVVLDTSEDDLPELYANDCVMDFHRDPNLD